MSRHEKEERWGDCPDCDGTKSVEHFPEEWGGRVTEQKPCETCQDDVDISKLFDPENFLEGTFRKLCDEFNLEHGDISIQQAFRLDALGHEIKCILTSFVEQNLPGDKR